MPIPVILGVAAFTPPARRVAPPSRVQPNGGPGAPIATGDEGEEGVEARRQQRRERMRRRPPAGSNEAAPASPAPSPSPATR
jgi:hypothetical protein